MNGPAHDANGPSPGGGPPPLPSGLSPLPASARSPARPRSPAGPPFIARVKWPWATFAIFLVNAGVYAVQAARGDKGEGWVMEYLAQDRVAVWEGQYWRLITAVFAHTMFIHFAMNMAGHVLLGRVMERILGSWRFLCLYLVSGLAGSLFLQMVSDAGVGVGASGAVYGVAGALLLVAHGRTLRGDLFPGRKFLWVTFTIVAMDQVFAYVWEKANPSMRIANSAHLGGLLCGAVLGYVLTPRPPAVRVRILRRRAIAASGLAAGIVVAGIYGCFFTVHDKAWGRTANLLTFERRVKENRLEAAVEAWRKLEMEDEKQKREIGYWLFEQFMAARKEDLAWMVLDDAIRLAEPALEEALRKGDPPADLLNEVAWYHALRGTDLKEALGLSEEAVRISKAAGGGLWRWLPRGRKAQIELGMFLNTRGWIRLHLGDSEGAIEDLKEAAEVLPVGANFLYLAIAQERLGDLRAAREAAREAQRTGELSAYEKRLLDELKARLKR